MNLVFKKNLLLINMGNCCKKTSDIFGEYNLLEPLVTNEDITSVDEHCNVYKTLPPDYDKKINNLNAKIATLQSNLDLLEKNTQDNLRLLSEDIYYINSKHICKDPSNNSEYEEKQEDYHGSVPPPPPEEAYEDDNTQENKELTNNYYSEEDCIAK